MEHRRIHRAKDKEDVIQALMASDSPIFKEIWRVLIFAAAVGFWNKKTEVLSSVDSARGIDFQTFQNNSAWPGFLYLMALVETQDSAALTGEVNATEQRITIFEQYANAGLSLIRSRCEAQSYTMDSIMALMLETNPKAEASGDLADVAI
jgi:dnd system-associated protein 4